MILDMSGNAGIQSLGVTIRVLSDGWTCITADGKPAAHYENTIFITKDGPELLTRPNYIEKDGSEVLTKQN